MALPFDDELTQFLAQNIWLDPLLLPSKFPLPTELITPSPLTTTTTTSASPFIFPNTFPNNYNLFNDINHIHPNNNNNHQPITTPPTTKSTKNKSHNAIERRYRNNINERIAELKAAVPALQHTKQQTPNNTHPKANDHPSPEEDDDLEEYIDGVAVATKINKATIMRKATEYIVHLQNTNEQLNKENQILEQLIHQLPGGIPVLNRYNTMKQQQQKQEKDKDQTMNFPLDDSQQDNQQHNTFMALFMCLSFSMDQNITSSSTTNPHHHRNVFDTSTYSPPVPTYDLWAYIRLALLVVCLVVLLFRRRHDEKQSTFMLLCSLAAESIQLMLRHAFNYTTTNAPYREQETERWIDIHANPASPLLLRLYACIRMINVAPPHLLTYAYACAAMQFYPYSTWVARYFWRMAMYETDDDMLVWDVHQPPCEDAMLDSQAWKEAVERNADLEELSRLHLLDNLRTELGRLIISVTSSPPSSQWTVDPKNKYHPRAEEEQTAFERILYEVSHQHPFPQWLAAVGATVEALWQSDVETAERAVQTMEKEQDLVKVKIKLVLQAAIRLQKGDLTGIDLLDEAGALQKKIKKSLGYRQRRPTMTRPIGLEGETMALAEFVACLAGLHAWIEAWRLDIKGAAEQIKAQTLVLRRMMRCSTLEKLPAHQVLVDRLSRLGYFVSPNGSDDEEEDEDYQNDNEQTRPSKALDILRGLA